MSREKQRRHSLPNISTSSTPRSTSNVPLGASTPRTPRTLNGSPLSNNAPPKARRHSISQPPAFGTSLSRRPTLSPLPETDHPPVVYPVPEVTVNSLVDAYLKDADIHLKLEKLPDGSNVMEAVLSEMRLEYNQTCCGNDVITGESDDVIRRRVGDNVIAGNHVIRSKEGSKSSDGVLSEKVTCQNSEPLIQLNTSPKRK